MAQYSRLLLPSPISFPTFPCDIASVKHRSLEKDNYNYQLLLRPFITIIWNADKHTGTIKHVASKRIEFIANEGMKRKTYASFIQLTSSVCITLL
jgi:hypothetical protein